MTNENDWIDTPGLKTVLEKDVPLAGKLLADGRYPILVRGAPRTGKSHIRNMVLKASKLKMIKQGVINCAAIPKDLAESMLFGHKAGAFTGAIKDKKGLLYDKSSPPKVVFLEEIGELPNDVQAKLLVFLDTGFIMPVGSDWGEGVKSTLRIVATSNAEDGSFRPDFIARFWEVKVPPIHERREDVPYFLQYFLENDNRRLSFPNLFYLMTHNWPGGVTEIEKVCINIRHFLKQNRQQQLGDYVRRLLLKFSSFESNNHYYSLCTEIFYKEENSILARLFPHFIGPFFYHDDCPISMFDSNELSQEFVAWCYFFWQDPKSPSNINENLTFPIDKNSTRELFSESELENKRVQYVLSSTQATKPYFKDVLNSMGLMNKEGMLLLNNLRELAFGTLCRYRDEVGKHSEKKSQLPSFENTPPKDYRNQFWEYQVKLSRTGREVEEIYGIKKKTAEGNLKLAKKRLKHL